MLGCANGCELSDLIRTFSPIENSELDMPVNGNFMRKAVWQSGLIILLALCLGLITNQFRADGLALVGNWSVEARLSAPSGRSLIVSLEEARDLHQSGQALFLDARPDIWFEMGHIKGAGNLPAEAIEANLARVLDGVPKDRPIVTYCDGETCELSHDLAIVLLERGYSDVRVLINGWTVWSESGLPVEGE